MKRLIRLLIELVVLLAIYLLGCQLAVWLAWPIPGGVVGLACYLQPSLAVWSNRRPCNWAPVY